MILWIVFLLAMCFTSVKAFVINAPITCQRSFSKIGCFKETNIRPDLALRPMTLEITDRDTSSPKYQGYLIDWSNMEASAHSLACRCASAARSMKMNYFSLRFWGECWVGKTDIAKLVIILKDSKWQSTDCVNSWSYVGVCDHKHEKECVAKAGSGYIYFLDDASKSEEKVDGGYSEWSSFTECSTTCGLGMMERERTCTNPAPLGKGNDCTGFGPMTEEKPCNLQECPVNGGISEWTIFGACSKSCGGGISLRTRSCTNPSPSNGGKGCSESVQETKNCASDPCPVKKCSLGWLEYGSYCYLFNSVTEALQGRNWKDSLSSCQRYGGNLLSVADQAENSFIVNQLKNDNMKNNHYWIGLSEGLKIERKFMWSDSTALVFSNWKPNEPNNHMNRNEECVEATVDGWNDEVCASLYGFICKARRVSPVGKCANGWLEYGSYCYLFNTVTGASQGKSWKDSLLACQSYGGDLLSVRDQAENVFILNQLKNDNMKNSHYWIGLNELKDQRKFMWSDSTALMFSNWKPNEPNNHLGRNEECVEATVDGWNDELCSILYGFICKVKQVSHVGKCANGWLEYGSYCYLFNTVTGSLQGKSWKDSFLACQSYGGHLLSVTDQAENLFILNQFKNDNIKNSHYWIGLSEVKSERKFKFMWSDSTDLVFSNWKPNEPNNHMNRNEECVEATVDGWNDEICASLYGFICKARRDNVGKCSSSWLEYGSYCYLFNTAKVQGKNWKDSLLTCQSYGGNLLSVTDQTENVFIINQLKNDDMKNNHYWIGLNAFQDQRMFMWSDSTSLIFSNWKPNEPNNHLGRKEECVEATVDGWNDEGCSALYGFICKANKA